MPFQRGAQRPQVQVAVDTAELLARLDHAGGAPAQRHLPIAPALDVRAAITTNADLDSMALGERGVRARVGGTPRRRIVSAPTTRPQS
jgi:hypothetical protein